MLPDETSRCDEIFLNFLADPRPAALRILQGKPLLGIDFGRVDFGFVVWPRIKTPAVFEIFYHIHNLTWSGPLDGLSKWIPWGLEIHPQSHQLWGFCAFGCTPMTLKHKNILYICICICIYICICICIYIYMYMYMYIYIQNNIKHPNNKNENHPRKNNTMNSFLFGMKLHHLQVVFGLGWSHQPIDWSWLLLEKLD